MLNSDLTKSRKLNQVQVHATLHAFFLMQSTVFSVEEISHKMLLVFLIFFLICLFCPISFCFLESNNEFFCENTTFNVEFVTHHSLVQKADSRCRLIASCGFMIIGYYVRRWYWTHFRQPGFIHLSTIEWVAKSKFKSVLPPSKKDKIAGLSWISSFSLEGFACVLW